MKKPQVMIVRTSPARDLNPGPPEYELGLVPTPPRLGYTRTDRHLHYLLQ
jgi:hypothetical protein